MSEEIDREETCPHENGERVTFPVSSTGQGFKVRHSVMEKLRATWSSYTAHFKMANAYRLKKRLAERFSWIGELFYHDKDRLKIVNRALDINIRKVFTVTVCPVVKIYRGGCEHDSKKTWYNFLIFEHYFYDWY